MCFWNILCVVLVSRKSGKVLGGFGLLSNRKANVSVSVLEHSISHYKLIFSCSSSLKLVVSTACHFFKQSFWVSCVLIKLMYLSHCCIRISLLLFVAMKPHEIQEKLGLTRIRDRNWYVQPSCATTGDGLYEGLTWLTSNIKT